MYELEHFLLDKGEIGLFLCKAFDECKKREPGMSKTIWDISVIAYLINKEWFEEEQISCPIVLDNGKYKTTKNTKKVTFINNLSRNKIYQDFFIKMGN